ncbi:MAG TPA: hypothetical protein VFK13_02345 [Gemmatimonadaceae bacterium]|nr:hypothetical protein [Gemmatimonadaceae bacterium]
MKTHEESGPHEQILFEALYPGVQPPERATAGSAGYDVRAFLDGRRVRCSDGVRAWEEEMSATGATLEIAPGVTVLVPLGFRARLPHGWEAQVRLRSSLAFRKGLVIPNAPGTIDCDYPDEWLVMMRGAAAAPVQIAHGERIAQIVLSTHGVLPWVPGVVKRTTREGGVGSTGSF